MPPAGLSIHVLLTAVVQPGAERRHARQRVRKLPVSNHRTADMFFARTYIGVMLVALCGASAPAQSRLDSIQALQEVEVVAGRRHEVIPAQKLERKQLEALSTYSVADAIRYFGGVLI